MGPQEDVEKLRSEALPIAKRMLEDSGEFFPYGAYIKPGGEIVHVGAVE
jgi:hypothetical protein